MFNKKEVFPNSGKTLLVDFHKSKVDLENNKSSRGGRGTRGDRGGRGAYGGRGGRGARGGREVNPEGRSDKLKQCPKC